MHNLRMLEKLENGEAIDLCENSRTKDGDYVLGDFIPNMDYCDSEIESWIGSIGQHLESNQIVASVSTKFYNQTAYKCLFLR